MLTKAVKKQHEHKETENEREEAEGPRRPDIRSVTV